MKSLIEGAIQYKNCLAGRVFKYSKVNKHFGHVSQLYRKTIRQKSSHKKSVKLMTKHNPKLPRIASLLKKRIIFLPDDCTLKTILL